MGLIKAGLGAPGVTTSLTVTPEDGYMLDELTVEENGATDFLIKAVPVDIPKIDVGAFFNQLLGEVSGYRAIKLEELLKDKLAQAACKAAIKGGMDISRAEIDELFKQMDGNMGLKCPHGRPVVVKITRKELEKMFKRIV